MSETQFLSAISWSPPVPIETLRVERSRLPQVGGVYVFTSYQSTVEKNFGVLYVGKATNLAKRVLTYLTDPSAINIFSPRGESLRLNTSLKHVGKVHLLVEIQQKYRNPDAKTTFIWVRWVIDPNPSELERKLIEYLQPKFNERLR